MQKLYVLFQTRELSNNGYEILYSNNNDLDGEKIVNYFNSTFKYPSWKGLCIGEDIIRFVKKDFQDSNEKNREIDNCLLIINKNIKNLNAEQINMIIEKANYFYDKTFIELKIRANKEEYSHLVNSKEISDFENELLTEIPELKMDFIEKSKNQISAIKNFFSDDSNKKIKYLVGVLIISMIVNIILLISRSKEPIQVETTKVTTELTENKNKEIARPVNVPFKASEDNNKVTVKFDKEEKSINGNMIESNTFEKTSSEVNEDNKETEPNENDIASLRIPKIRIKHKPSKVDKESIEEYEQKKEVKGEQKSINKFEFIDEIANNYEIHKDDLIKLVNEKTQWKDFDNLGDDAINQLKDFLDKPDNILFIKLDGDKKESLKKFFNFGFNTLNKEYVSKCKKAISSFVKAYYELYKNKDIKEKYSELYQSYYPKDRLDFVCHILDIKLESKHNLDESKSYTYIFTENDYKNAKWFEKIFMGRNSFAEKYLKNTIQFELDMKTRIIHCEDLFNFLAIYNSKFKNIINKKLSLENLEKKLVNDFGNCFQDMKTDYLKFQDLPENSDLKINDLKKKFVHQLISEKVNSNDFEKELQNLNELYEKFLTTVERMEEIK